MDDVEIKRGGQLEYTDDVYTNSRSFFVGGKSCWETWMGGLEYVGKLPCVWYTPRLFTSDGYYIRIKGTQKEIGKGEAW